MSTGTEIKPKKKRGRPAKKKTSTKKGIIKDTEKKVICPRCKADALLIHSQNIKFPTVDKTIKKYKCVGPYHHIFLEHINNLK